MKNLEKHRWAGWCPRRGKKTARNREHTRRGSSRVRADRVCGFARVLVRVAKGRMRVCGRQYEPHTLPFLCPLSHAQARSRAFPICYQVHVHAYTDRILKGVWVRARVHRRKENTCRAFTGATSKASGFTARINSGSMLARGNSMEIRKRAAPSVPRSRLIIN